MPTAVKGQPTKTAAFVSALALIYSQNTR